MKCVLISSVILLTSCVCVKPIFAQETQARLMLDSGFVGRPVQLDLFQGALSVSWNESALTQPTEMLVTLENDGAKLSFSNSAAFSYDAKIHIGVTDVGLEHPAMEVVSNGERNVVPVVDKGEKIIGTVDVDPEMIVRCVNDESVTANVVSVSSVVDVRVSDVIAPIVAKQDKKDSVSLMLDSGFVGRPVSLELFNGDVVISWDDATLVEPSQLTITRANGGEGKDQESASDALIVQFANANAISAGSSFKIMQRAYSPQSASERVEVNAIGQSMSNGTFAGEFVEYSIGASSSVSVAPMYREGIMRSGMASWYRYKNCNCAASPDVPKGTQLKVSRQDNPSVSVIITVNDWGPDRIIHPERVIDLDYVAFSAIGNPRGGILAVNVEKVTDEQSLALNE